MFKWFYSRGSDTYGPFTSDEIKSWATKGLLRAEDWIWQEGSDRASGTAALAAFDFDHLPNETTPAPDWLADVAQSQTLGPVPPLQPNPELPEWITDLRLWYGLEAFALAKSLATSKPPTGVATDAPLPIPCDQIPDWLADLIPVAKPFLPPPPTPPQPAAPSLPPSTTARDKPSPTPSAAPAIPIAVQIARPVAPPIAAVVSAPPSIKRTSLHTPKALTRLAEQAIQETGFDPRTGQTVDPAQLEKWKQQQAHPGAAARAPTPSLMEVFRKSRTAIENWIDDEKHRPLILKGDIAAIEREPDIQAILAESSKYGPPMLQKLQAHLAFLVENRRKYHAAYSAYFGSPAKK